MKKSVLASLMLAGGAVALWVSSRLAWLTVTADDDKAGTKTVTIHGASWSTELIAAAIMLAAAAIAGLILRRAGRGYSGCWRLVYPPSPRGRHPRRAAGPGDPQH